MSFISSTFGDVYLYEPETKLAVSLSGEVRVDISDGPEVPPLLFARWCVGVLGGGVTVTCVFAVTCVEFLCIW